MHNRARLAEARGITKRFGDHEVLTGVDLTVEPGEILGLMGRNGAGKSTLASILSGGLAPDSGRLAFLHEHERDGAFGDSVSVIEQTVSLDPHMNVAQAIVRNTPSRDLPPDEQRREVQRLLISLGIALGPGDPVGALGMPDIGLLESVRLLAEEHPLVIADEVSATFNPREMDELEYVLRRITAEGRSVIYITQRVDEALRVCHRIAILRDGRIDDVVGSATTSPEKLRTLILGHEAPAVEAVSHAVDEVCLSVEGLARQDGTRLSFELRVGEVLGVVDEDRADSRALVRALTGDEPGGAERITFRGAPAEIWSPADATALGIAFLGVTETYGVGAHESIARGMLTAGLSVGQSFEDEVAAVLRIMRDLDEAAANATWMPRERHQSGGQRQRQAMIDFVSDGSALLIVAEPFRWLDIGARAEVTALLHDVTAHGRSVILVSADPAELAGVCDRTLVL